MTQSKWRNGGMWVSMASALLLAVQAVAAPFGYEITNELIAQVMTGVNALLAVLAVAGVVSNPSSGSGYKDEE